MPEQEYKTGEGEGKAWRELEQCEPGRVAANAMAVYDTAAGIYSIEILGESYVVDPRERTLVNASNPARQPEYLLALATPVYLVNARPVPPSGELVKEFKGGEFFFRGSHTLPLEDIAVRYGRDPEGFGDACMEELGGVSVSMGDRGFGFNVYPRVSMVFVLWLEDDEFPARAVLLFDSNADKHMPLDALWAVALLSCQRLLKFTPSKEH